MVNICDKDHLKKIFFKIILEKQYWFRFHDSQALNFTISMWSSLPQHQNEGGRENVLLRTENGGHICPLRTQEKKNEVRAWESRNQR